MESWMGGSSGRMSRATLPISNTLPPRLDSGFTLRLRGVFVRMVCTKVISAVDEFT